MRISNERTTQEDKDLLTNAHVKLLEVLIEIAKKGIVSLDTKIRIIYGKWEEDPNTISADVVFSNYCDFKEMFRGEEVTRTTGAGNEIYEASASYEIPSGTLVIWYKYYGMPQKHVVEKIRIV